MSLKVFPTDPPQTKEEAAVEIREVKVRDAPQLQSPHPRHPWRSRFSHIFGMLIGI